MKLIICGLLLILFAFLQGFMPLQNFLPQLPSTLRNHPSIKNAISQIKTLSAHRTSGNQESVNAQSSRPSTTVDDPIVINNLEEQQRLSSTNYRNQSGQECRTAPCVISASNMERLIDWKAEPCDDFYDFACGSFVRDSTLHDRRDSLNAFSMTNDKLKDQLRRLFTRKSQPDEIEPYRLVKDLYSSCTDTDAHDAVGIGPLRELILATGGWPMLDDSKWSESNWDLERAILQLRTVIGHQNINIFRTLSVGLPSFKQAAAASSGGQSMNASVTLEYVDKINAIFRSYLTDIASLMGADKRRIEAQLDDAIEFQNNLIKLNSHYENAVINTARLPTINGFGRNELHVKHSLMRWMDLLNPLPLKLFAASTSSTEAVNDARAFWKAFEELLAKTSKRTLANYFVIRIIGFAAPHMTTDIKKRALHYQMLFLGIKKREETWKECVDVVSDLLQLAVEAMFSKEYFDLESKAFAIDMARRIKETYVKQLSTISWLSQREKAEALLKIDRRIAELSFPTELLSDRQIKIIYRNLKVQPQNYLESIFGISIFNADRRFLLMQTGLKLGSSSDSAGLLNSVDVKKNNKILYPSGVLQREVVSPDRPNYLNYASSGFVIGYIFSQSFEKSFQETQAFPPKIQEAVECFVRQYDNYTDPDTGIQNDGRKTLDANIADNGSIKIAYAAYKKWQAANGNEASLPALNFSNEQFFWLSFAQLFCSVTRPEKRKSLNAIDPNSIERFRVIGALQNSRAFAEAWNCPINSPMNPSKKCIFF